MTSAIGGGSPLKFSCAVGIVLRRGSSGTAAPFWLDREGMAMGEEACGRR